MSSPSGSVTKHTFLKSTEKNYYFTELGLQNLNLLASIQTTETSQSSIRRLQLVQNAAAQILTNTPRREHITPILTSLHWFPVHFGNDFKFLLLTFKALNGNSFLWVWEDIKTN